ncbi:MAG: S-methyl-5-thioribose-1-phosphate isomerase [Actinobacteria bacterium]|nr:S-methyl-5-thioribose-1-phosphate isomerase [Actinomycetota bacterium]
MENIKEDKDNVKTLIWDKKSLRLIDQRKLPFKKIYANCRTAEDVASAIKNMVVRGAPAIGVTAAYGAALAALEYKGSNRDEFIRFVLDKIDLILAARPTAVNLFWSMAKMRKVISDNKNLSIDKIRDSLIEEAELIEKEDFLINCKLGENGARIFSGLKKKMKILTHCNAGALATSGYGTALGVIRSLYQHGKVANVIVDETRPYLQGARLTAWELYQEGIPFFIISDNMSGYFMSGGEVDIVVAGADRIAANGDSANKIGTLSLSILAKYYKIPFYIAAPVSTIDLQTKSGKDIPIEYRGADEIRTIFGKKIIPDYMPVSNPAFDVTPNENITAIITEKGVIYSPFSKNIKKLFIDF